jgi:hypothetical protein
MKQQFTIESLDEAKRCEASFRHGKPVTVEGKDVLTGENRTFSGFVVSVESVSGRPTRVTIITEDRRKLD